jgi:hypothetical protein
VEAASAWPRAPLGDMAAGKREFKRGLATWERTVILMLDETIITETPPLYACYGRSGEHVCVPITGHHARRILHGVLNVQNGEVLLWLFTQDWVQETPQAFLRKAGVLSGNF